MAFYLVTGGAGFIGSNLCKRLLEQGNRVRIIDNFSSGRLENIKTVINDVEVIEEDIRRIDALKKAVKGVDYVLHHAAIASVQESIRNPVVTNQTNIEGMLNVLTASKEEGLKRVVFASSSSVYGDREGAIKDEEMLPDPLSPYAVTKLIGEMYAKYFYSSYGLEVVSLRYFNVFGPNQNPSSPYSGVISIFVDYLKNSKAPIIYGDGNQTRDFVYVDNIVEANIKAALSEKVGHGETINIASGNTITLNKLVQTLNQVLKKDIKPIYKEKREGDILNSAADITLAKELLDYEIKIDLEEGLRKTIGS